MSSDSRVPGAGAIPHGFSVCLLLPHDPPFPEAVPARLQEICSVEVGATKEEDIAAHERRGDRFLPRRQVQHGGGGRVVVAGQEWD